LNTTAVARARRYVAINDTGHRIGEGHPRAKLSDEQVEEMRQLYEQGDHGYRRLSTLFGVPKRTVRDIVLLKRRNQWADRHKIIVDG
jgi:hypothetical protein